MTRTGDREIGVVSGRVGMYAMDKPKTCSKCQFYGEQNNFHYQ